MVIEKDENDELDRSYEKWSITRTQGREIRGLLEKYPTFGREKETGLLGALDT